MISDTAGRTTRRKTNGFDQELDALVARELEALSTREARFDPRQRSQSTKRNDQAAAKKSGADKGETPQADKPPPQANNVVGIRTTAIATGDGVPFSEEEEAFIEQALTFLRGRPNADVIIEDLWTLAVLRRDDLGGDALDEGLGFHGEFDSGDGDAALGDAFPEGSLDAPGATDRRPQGSPQAGRTKPSLIVGRPDADSSRIAPPQELAAERHKDADGNERGSEGPAE